MNDDVRIHNSEVILGYNNYFESHSYLCTQNSLCYRLIQCPFSGPIELSLSVQEKDGSLIEIKNVPVQNKVPFLLPIPTNYNKNNSNIKFDHLALIVRIHTADIILYHQTLQLGKHWLQIMVMFWSNCFLYYTRLHLPAQLGRNHNYACPHLATRTTR